MESVTDFARDVAISKRRKNIHVYEQWLQDNPDADIEAVREVRRRLAETKAEILDLIDKQ